MGYMEQNTASPTEQVETIAVDADDVIEAIRFNARPPEYKNQRSAVIRISPPFGAQCEATVHYSEEGTYYPPEMDPKPVHIDPMAFIGDFACDVPNRSDERARAQENLNDPTDDDISEYIETAFDVWESEARSDLKQTVDIYERQRGSQIVEVEYEE